MLLNRILKGDSRFRDELVKAVAVVADNVSHYFYVTNDQEYWDLGRDFPNVAPPWPNIWFEWPIPQYINSTEFGYYKNPEYEHGGRIGGLLMYQELDKYKITKESKDTMLKMFISQLYIKTLEEEGKNYNIMKDKVDSDILQLFKQAKGDAQFGKFIEEQFINNIKRLRSLNVRWVFTSRFWLERPNVPVLEFPSMTQGFVSGEGRFIGVNTAAEQLTVMPEKYIAPDLRQAWADSQAKWHHVPFMALCFCHCKNVTASEHKLAEGKISVQKKKKRTAVYKYYVLEIDAMKKTLKQEGNAEKTGIKKALHICRGNFATYTKESPLFGRFVGTVWRPMHTKGSLDHGAVIKDYRPSPDQ